MWSPPVQQVPRWLAHIGHGVLLIVALSFVVTVTYLPHMETAQGHRPDADPYTRLVTLYAGWANGSVDDYEYFMHVDEPVHWIRGRAMQDADSLKFDNPYTGSPYQAGTLDFRGLVHEKGFYVAMGSFQEMTGVGWADLVRLFPALWAAVTAALVWAALRPWSGAPLAAAFVALVPTSARFLGIGFFVPIGIGLAWIAVVLALSRRMATDRTALALVLVLAAWAFFIHLIVGFACLLVVLLTVPLQLTGDRRNVLLLSLALVAPVVALYGAFAGDITAEAEKFGSLPIDYSIFDQIGVPFLFAWILGTGLMTLRPPLGRVRLPIVTATMGSVVIFAMMVVNFAFDLRLYALYDRWHQPFALLAGVPVTFGIVALLGILRDGIARLETRTDHARVRRGSFGTGPAAVVLATLIAGAAGAAVAAEGTAYHLEEDYYRVLSDADWASYLSARDLGPEYQVFLSHPWKAPAYLALSAKHPYAWLDPGSPPARGDDYVAYKIGKHADDAWLVERDITVVLDETGPTGALWTYHSPGVWVMDPVVAAELSALRGR